MSTDSPSTEKDTIETQLDELLPRPMSSGRRALVAIVLLTVTVASGVLWESGRVSPSPFGSGFGAGPLWVTEVSDLNAPPWETRLYVPNNSERGVRLTKVSVAEETVSDSEVRVALAPQPDPADCVEISPQQTDCVTTPIARLAEPWGDQNGLPITIPPHRDAEVMVRFPLPDCPFTDKSLSLQLTFDFGDGAFPSWSRTINYPASDSEINGIQSSVLVQLDDDFFGAGRLCATDH